MIYITERLVRPTMYFVLFIVIVVYNQEAILLTVFEYPKTFIVSLTLLFINVVLYPRFKVLYSAIFLLITTFLVSYLGQL
jgi:hypothetical protein